MQISHKKDIKELDENTQNSINKLDETIRKSNKIGSFQNWMMILLTVAILIATIIMIKNK